MLFRRLRERIASLFEGNLSIGEADYFATEALEDAQNHDKYFKAIMSNAENAKDFFYELAPKELLKQIDLETLQVASTKTTGADGKVAEGDVFYLVEIKKKYRRKGARRAALTIILEHKSQSEPYVAIQLLKYVVNTLDYMRVNAKEYADEQGRLPTPYVVLFSQDGTSKRPALDLRRVLYWLDGFEKSVPNFWFQTIYAQDIPIEKIRNCKPLMRAFLYLEQIAKKAVEEGEEPELVSIFEGFLSAKTLDERLRQGVFASINYMNYLKKKRRDMVNAKQVFDHVKVKRGIGMDLTVEEMVQLCFGDVLERNGIQRDLATIAGIIRDNLEVRFGCVPYSPIMDKIDMIDDLSVLKKVQRESWRAADLPSFERKVDSIIRELREDNQSRVLEMV